MRPSSRQDDFPQSRAWPVNDEPMTPISRTKSKPRDPPPALFLHPSPAASHVSLPGILTQGAQVPGPGPAGRSRKLSNADTHGSLHPGAALSPDGNRPRTLQPTESTRSTDRTDALWAEMQATLEEVELSASGGTHVFGPEHERKLADLRVAQIALAQAWARNEADDIEASLRDNGTSAAGDDMRNMKGAQLDPTRSAPVDGTDGAKSTAAATSTRPGSSGGGMGQLGASLEEETELDILSARKRREANDLYFQRVNDGVMDVVAKLDEVAEAMRAVEQESKDLWNENGSISDSTRA
ncbi:hypothetical protein B0I35DRAFT_431148 [Stachybotrys elegans]|uniref:Uncharacterized protein n=1 Tax=Stachybotrys elegans TaxID=80388 RepID=A0A8K0STS0_9HYPO|nr:hypothetical protein B0I35DRAFT_431148 [Stachybotrys elegans]